MKKNILASAIVLLPVLCGAGVQAADSGVTGYVMPSVRVVDVSGNEAKFSEYGDPDSGLSGGVWMNYDAEASFLNFNADNIADDTKDFRLEAGQYGAFTLDAFYNEIQHNNTFGATTFFAGAGSNQLTSPLSGTPPPSPAAWGNPFDYAVSRDQYGAGIKLNMLKPFFVNLSVAQEDRAGLKPIGVGNTAPGAPLVAELPEPVDYKTNRWQTEVGFGKDPYFAALSYTNSRFENAYQSLFYTNIFAIANQSEFVTLAPDNDFSKLDLKGRVKLPWQSTLALAFAQSEAESETNLATGYNLNGASTAVTLSDNVFNGRVETKHYSAVLTTRPLALLDAKIFYKNYDTENQSDIITSVEGVSSYTSVPFDYSKRSYGAEAGLKLPGHITLTPAYTNMVTTRQLADAPRNDDNIYRLDAKWAGLDFMSAEIGYVRQDSDDNTDAVITTSQTNKYLLSPYTRRFDTAAKNVDTYKFGFDIFPTEKLNLGFTLQHQNTDYTETGIGFTGGRSNNYGTSVNFTPNATVSIAGYVDYETATLDMLQRQGAITAALANASPVDTNAADNAYNVTTDQEDTSLDYGLAVDVIVIPSVLTIRAQYDHVRSDGQADFTYASDRTATAIPAGWDNDSIDYSAWDDYKKDALQLRGTYSLSPSLDLIGGYVYEKYRYNDGHYDSYAYVYTTASGPAYLSGANAFPAYTANVYFLTAKYKF